LNKSRIISPSLLSADFSRLEKDIRDVEQAGATRLHLDVMDGHFVPNITFGPFIVKAIRKLTNCILDCHLMILNPDKYIEAFIDAGANTVILHIEAHEDLTTEFTKIRKLGCSAGISLNPDTPIKAVEPYLDLIDHVLVMSVHPGFGGQKFIKSALQKIEYLAENRKNRNFVISVDGGVNIETIADVFQSGTDIAVVGSGLFSADNRSQQYRDLRNA